MIRVRVHIVTGTERASASALIARCIAAHPDWAGLELQSCPCCTGRAELQVRLARLLRERHPSCVLIGVIEPQHLPGVERVLATWPLVQYVVPGRALRVPEDATLSPDILDAC